MKIVVKSREARNIWFVFPTSWVLNSFVAGVLAKEAEEAGTGITKEQILCLMREIKSYRKAHPEWMLVDIETKDGEIVKIKI